MRTAFVGRGYDVIFSLNTASVVHAPKVALFSLRQLLGTVFRERALRSALETICAKARENAVNFFLFFQVMPSGVKYYGSYCCAAWCNNNGRTGRERGTKWFRIPRDDREPFAPFLDVILKLWLSLANYQSMSVAFALFCRSAS